MLGSTIGTPHMEPTKYEALVQALLTGSMDPFDRENAIKIALGKLADVWPESIEKSDM